MGGGLSLTQEDIVQTLEHEFRQQKWVKAAWLTGSLARPGDADRHSDIDLHLWLEEGEAGAFRATLEDGLGSHYPVLLHHELFDGHMVVCLLQAANHEVIALDLFIETASTHTLLEGKSRILFDRTGQLEQSSRVSPEVSSLRNSLDTEIRYFWRLFAMLPSLERGERIPCVQRLSQEAAQLVQVCTLGRRRPRDVGEKRANELLTLEEQQEIESVLALPNLSSDALVSAHLALATQMQKRGRQAADALDTAYPEPLERAVLAYVQGELERMGALGSV